MSEKIPNVVDSQKIERREIPPENIPNESEITAKLAEVLSGREYSQKRKVEDEEGIVCWDLMTTEPNGDTLEISYDRAKVLKNGTIAKSRITHTLFDSEGMPCSAGTQYDYENGVWLECL